MYLCLDNNLKSIVWFRGEKYQNKLLGTHNFNNVYTGTIGYNVICDNILKNIYVC